jgi:AcrR family transcriptional regulator
MFLKEGSGMTRKEPRDKRIGDILEAAVSEFLDNGYERTSMDAIARRAGLTKGGLYHHFRSKDEVLLLANQTLLEPINGLIEEVRGFSSAVEGLRHYIREYLSLLMSRPRSITFFFLSMTKVMASAELSAMYRDYTFSYTGFFTRVFARAIEQGELRAHNPQTQALAMVSALDGVLWYLVINDSIDLEETIRGFEQTFIDSLLVEP